MLELKGQTFGILSIGIGEDLVGELRAIGSQVQPYASLAALFAERCIASDAPSIAVLSQDAVENHGLQYDRTFDEIKRHFGPNQIVLIGNSARPSFLITCLNHVAADYLLAPFGAEEIVARSAILNMRRIPPPVAEDIAVGDITISLASRLIEHPDKRVKLSKTELRFMHLLSLHREQFVSREHIRSTVWPGRTPSDNAMNRKIYALRRKLLQVSSIVTIETAYARGVRLICGRLSVQG